METPLLEHKWFEQEFSSVYNPSEDTFLLLDALESDIKLIDSFQPLLALEIGCGSGIVTTALSSALSHRQMLFLGTDVNEKAAELTVKCAAKNAVFNVETVVTNLVDGFHERFFPFVDLVVFNPPYVVTANDEVKESGIWRSWAGGENGRFIIDEFMQKVVPLFTSQKCLIYLVVIQENKPEDICCVMKRSDFNYAKVIIERRCRNERLKVLRFSKQRID